MTKAQQPYRLSKSALFDAVRYAPHPGQTLVHKSTALRRILCCGSRWGKTTAAIYELIAALLEPREEAIGWIVSPTYELSSRIFHRVCAVLQQYFKHHVIELSLRDRMITVRNFGGGVSILVAKSADNPDSLLGEGLSFLVIDEAARLDEAVWNEFLSQRLIDRKGWLLALSTPHGCNWFFRLHKRGLKGRDSDYESWSSPSWENPALDKAAIEGERKRLLSAVFDEQYGAKFVGEDKEPCDVCHGPDPGAIGFVFAPPGGVLPKCAECGHEVDANGRSVVARRPNGTAHLMIVTFENRPDRSDLNVQRIPVPGTHRYSLSIGAEPGLPGDGFDPLVPERCTPDEGDEFDLPRPEGYAEVDVG